DAVGQVWRQRAGEDQQRIGQSERYGQNAGGAAAENVIKRPAQFWTETVGLTGHARTCPHHLLSLVDDSSASRQPYFYDGSAMGTRRPGRARSLCNFELAAGDAAIGFEITLAG